ncbi:flagellar assembly protein FliW [Paenibacillus sp. N3/727]|uniref:flagellar assembly protein FliW n=1 Tax=Paenibacillus sp. N3/727 TaxID=2925845 RepID=UPI001F5348B0|nr:flagellar assembly protein FliW [Paenibacillus sp. N3/727]UNK18070.1 flagellar assembly protein FliW [Paenibacillus sp. N3/727]
MMNVETAQFGQLEVPDEQVYHFSKGIPGFESHSTFAVIDVGEGPFSYLQSLQESHISLLMTDPFVFYPNYEFDLPESIVEEMELDSALLIRCIVTINEDAAQSTINLLAPLVFNLENKSARQVILHNSEYQSRHPLWLSGEKPTPSEKAGE